MPGVSSSAQSNSQIPREISVTGAEQMTWISLNLATMPSIIHQELQFKNACVPGGWIRNNFLVFNFIRNPKDLWIVFNASLCSSILRNIKIL